MRLPQSAASRVTAILTGKRSPALQRQSLTAACGMSVPTQRTLAMLCIFFAASGVAARWAIANALGLALIGALIVDPFAPLSIGAWLSFGAVAIIVIALAAAWAVTVRIVGFARVQWP